MIVKAKDLKKGDEFMYRDELHRVTVNETDQYSEDGERKIYTYVVARPRTAPFILWLPAEDDVELERRP